MVTSFELAEESLKKEPTFSLFLSQLNSCCLFFICLLLIMPVYFFFLMVGHNHCFFCIYIYINYNTYLCTFWRHSLMVWMMP